MGTYDKGITGYFPGFRMEIMRAIFPAAEKYCVGRAALNIARSRNKARCGRCFRALFSIPRWGGGIHYSVP
jgi:hypothetical protein